MKNKIIILLLLFSGGLFVSCNKWLDINPANQISTEKLFSDENGIENALNGIYQACAQPSLYGKTLSWGAVSAMGQNYVAADDSEIRYMMAYQYIVVPNIADGIWRGLYNAIANTNLLLKEISKTSPSMFALDTITKNVITGEALALRAFMHLDLVRLFAPAPIVDASAKLVPYHDKYPSELTIPLTTTETLDKIIEDLLEAKDLLAYNDTVYHYEQIRFGMGARFQGYYVPKGGDFFNKRGYRMNYPAILGLLSRAYLYKGDKENALKYARSFYDRFVIKENVFTFHQSYEYSAPFKDKQKKFLNECVFGFYNKSLLDVVENFYTANKNELFLAEVDKIYRNDEDDYRLYLIERNGAVFGNSVKYRRVDNNDQRDGIEGDAIPILRISEIYYTLIECYYEKGDEVEALRLLKEFRTKKGSKRAITTLGGLTELQDILINDARRECVGEGQLFFMYKRLNRGILYKGGQYAPIEARVTLQVPFSQNIN